MADPVALTHPVSDQSTTATPGTPRYRRLRLAGWSETSHQQVEAPTPPAWLSMPDPDLDTEDDLSEED